MKNIQIHFRCLMKFALPEPLQIHLRGHWKNFIEGTVADV